MKTSEFRKLIREEVCKLLAEATQQIPGKDGIIILVSDYAKKHIMEHNKPGMGSVFKSGITEDLIINMVKEVAPKLSGDGGAYELNKPGIGYDLVLPIDKARALKDAKEGEVEKQEGPNKVKVPSISTSQPLSSFVSNRVSLVIRKSNPQFLPDDVKNDTTIAEKIKERKCYSLLTAFPGNPDIPKASEWNGKFAVIVPDTKLGESKNMKTSELRKLIREEVRKTLNEAQAPSFKAKHKNNNLVAAIYFEWNINENNKQSLWDKVIQIIEQEDCTLINYVVTDSVCEFEFKPSIGVHAQDQLEDAKYRVRDALKPLSKSFTGYDVYIAGN